MQKCLLYSQVRDKTWHTVILMGYMSWEALSKSRGIWISESCGVDLKIVWCYEGHKGGGQTEKEGGVDGGRERERKIERGNEKKRVRGKEREWEREANTVEPKLCIRPSSRVATSYNAGGVAMMMHRIFRQLLWQTHFEMMCYELSCWVAAVRVTVTTTACSKRALQTMWEIMGI